MITIDIQDNATPAIQNFIARLADRRPLHQAIGARVREQIRDHMITLAGQRHTSAQRLGASPSGFLGQAARSVESRQPKADGQGVSIALPHPAFARAFGDVDIRPKTGLYLTIPLIAQAYNQRAYRIQGLFFFKSKTGKAFLAESIKAPGTKAKLRLWYLLVPGVHQKQDRSLLPSDELLLTAAQRAVRDYIAFLLAAKGASSQPSQQASLN